MNTTLDNFKLNPLTAKQLPLVLIDSKNNEWFSTNYQSRAQKKSPEYYSLQTLIEAVENSEKTFEQFPTDERNIRNIAQSIFIDSMWMQRDITLGSIEGNLYIIGGRHRVAAIANTLAQAVRHKHQFFAWSEQHLNEVFQGCLEMFVRCEVLYLGNKEDLLTLINADNQSRRMRKAEYGHLISQAYGADSESITSITDTLLSSDLSPKEAVTIAAQNFVRRHDSHLKPQTRQILGEKVAKHILYGSDTNKKIAASQPLLVRSKDEFEKLMDRAWEILLKHIEGEIVIAKNVNAIARAVNEGLDNQRKIESLSQPIEETLPGILVEPMRTPPRGSRKLTKA